LGSILEGKPRVVEPRSAAAAAAGGEHRLPDRGQVFAQPGHEEAVVVGAGNFQQSLLYLLKIV